MRNNSREVSDIGRFVRARREATAASAFDQIPVRRRHVDYLTQSELASLIGMSTVVISQIEQGRYPNLSKAILHRIAQALSFTEQQQIYIFGLFDDRPSRQLSPTPPPAWLITSIDHIAHPAMVLNPAYDIVAVSAKGRRFFGNIGAEFAPKRNAADTVFNLPGFRSFVQGWLPYAASLVSGMKINYAMYPAWRDYIDETADRLGENSELFASLWHQDDPLAKPTMEKTFHHPDLGSFNGRQILTDIIEVPGLTKVEIIPADEETRNKFGKL